MLSLESKCAVGGFQGLSSRSNGALQKTAFPPFVALPSRKGISRTSLKVRASGQAPIAAAGVVLPATQDFASSGGLNVVIPDWKKESEYFENSAHQSRAGKKAGKRQRKHNVFQQLAAATLDLAERTIIPYIEAQAPLPSTADPRVQLEGNFAPVPESAVQHELEIVGTLPQALEGMYLRNGANPRFTPLAGHHFFDGDGMIQAVRFKDGIASHCCRYTKTYRLQEEEKKGKAFFPKAIGELHGHGGIARLLLYAARGLSGLINMKQGMGVANAGLVFHNGRLLAMSEDDLPYAVSIRSDGDLETVGRFDFNGQHKTSMIAHPKIDPVTGELFALSYNVVKAPYLQYFSIGPDGTKSRQVDITLPGPTMIHDFAITEQYVVIPDHQVVFKMAELLKGKSPVVHDPTKTSRFGILPKYDADESRIQWVDVPDCFCFHLWNSWEDGDEVVILGSCMTPADSIFNEGEGGEELRSFLTEIRLNLKTGESTRRKLADINLEAGQLNRNYVGRKSRYLYMAIAEPWPKISGVAKVDMDATGSTEGAIVGKHIHPDCCYGGEPVFVPRTSDPTAEEDDGYVLTFRHDERTGKSELVVLDASTPNLDLLAAVQLPSRVPYGLHGTFVPADALATQKPHF